MDKKVYKVVLIDVPEHERLIFKLIFSVSEKSRSSVNSYVLADNTNEAEIVVSANPDTLDTVSDPPQIIKALIADNAQEDAHNTLLRPLIATRVLAVLDKITRLKIETAQQQSSMTAPVIAHVPIEPGIALASTDEQKTTDTPTSDEQAIVTATENNDFEFSISEQEASELAIVYDEDLMNPANLPEAETTVDNHQEITVKTNTPRLGEVIQAPIINQKQDRQVASTIVQADNIEDSSPRALVVDDSASVRKQLELELALFDVKVDYAGTAAETNELLEKNNYHVAFLDVMLPDSDGFQICKQIKSDSKSTNVVMLTGKASPADKVKGSLAGCDDYLVKPVGRQTFQNAAKKYLNMLEHEAMEA